MYCPKCGTENPDNAQLCSSCSWVLASTSIVSENPEARTSGMAIASLVLAVVSPFTCFITAIPAVVLGIISIFKIEKSAGQLKGKGLAIAGIAAPAILVPLMALMMGILMPALVKVRMKAKRVICIVHLKQVGAMMQIYADDCDGRYPTADKWCDLLEPYYSDSGAKVLVCPAAGEGRCHYAINPDARPKSAPDMVLLFETYAGWNQYGGPEILNTDSHRGEGCNILFNDGHVAFVKTEELGTLKWSGEQKE